MALSAIMVLVAGLLIIPLKACRPVRRALPATLEPAPVMLILDTPP